MLRTKKPLYESEKLFKGWAGTRRNLRAYHLYVLRPKSVDHIRLGGNECVAFSKRYLSARGGGVRSKAGIVREYLEKNLGRGFYSTQIVKALKGERVPAADVMANARCWEKRGFVYAAHIQYPKNRPLLGARSEHG